MSTPLTRGQLDEVASIGGLVTTKTMTFAGGTTNDPGDVTGTGNPATLFTVTGDVLVKLYAICTTALVGATATLAVGVTGDTGSILAQSTATDLALNDIWIDATPTTKVENYASINQYVVANGQDIIQTVGTADITAGALKYVCVWKPLSSDGNVVAA